MRQTRGTGSSLLAEGEASNTLRSGRIIASNFYELPDKVRIGTITQKQGPGLTSVTEEISGLLQSDRSSDISQPSDSKSAQQSYGFLCGTRRGAIIASKCHS